MTQVTLKFTVNLDESEFVEVEGNIYTTHRFLAREEPQIHLINPGCLNILKKFEGRLTEDAIKEWLLLSRALDQTCSYHNNWNDEKIIEELIAGREHPVSWYVDNCQLVK